MPVVGQTIAYPELQARWAFGELRSTRAAETYRRQFPNDGALFTAAKQGLPFEQLSVAQVSLLTSMHGSVRKPFIDHYKLDRYATFTCRALSKAELQNVLTMADFDLPARRELPFDQFVTSPCWLVDGKPAWNDPRVEIANVPASIGLAHMEAVVMLLRGGHLLLIEGYLRSLIFNRDAGPDDRLLAWAATSLPLHDNA